MVGVFAIAAVICLQSFAAANSISKRRSELDTAVLLAQDTCEMLKHAHGDRELFASLTGAASDGDDMIIYYGSDAIVSDRDNAAYFVTISNKTAKDGLGEAKVTVRTTERTVYELTAAWQEY